MDTTITVGKKRVATVIARNKAGKQVPLPAGYAVTGFAQYFDGGNLEMPLSGANTATFKAMGTKVAADYLPPRPAQIKAMIATPTTTLTLIANVGLQDATSSMPEDATDAVSFDIIWGDEQ
jgi:hypothetical protein